MIRFLSDENEIVKLFPLAISEGLENGEDVSKLNPDKLWNTLNYCMKNAAILVSEKENIITGCMIICPVDCYWADKITYTNLIYYVLPEHRKSKAGLSLLLRAKEWAKGKEFNFVVESTKDLERKDRFFGRLGFMKYGGYYKLRGKNA